MHMTTSIDSVGPKLKSVISSEAAELFESRSPNLLACTDAGQIYSAIASYFTFEGLPQFVRDDFSILTLTKATEDAFLTLLKRGALDEHMKVVPVPPLAQSELDKLAGVAPAVAPAADPRVEQAAAVAQCAEDFKSLGARSFKAKWMNNPTQRAIYEKAIVQLEADDRANALEVKRNQDARRQAAESQITRSF
jgi:hypothetical protein